MIDYVYDGLVSWFENIIMSVFDLVSMQFLDFFSLDLTNYFSYFPIVKSAFSIFVYVGMGFAIALLAGTSFASYLVYDTWICPCCGKHYEVDYDNYNYCPDCGQKLDWSDEE